MGYKVVITKVAQKQFEACLDYLAYKFKSKQAVKSVLEDYEETVKRLLIVADSLKFVENEKLHKLGYKRINFSKHRYFILFRLKGDVAYVEGILHELQDYEKRMY